MPFFKAPNSVMQNTRNTTWSETVSRKNIGGPRELWGDYWKRFNTMQIPMFGEEEYFNTAKAIAEVAIDEKDFEKLFMEKNSQRQKELMALIRRLSTATHWEKNLFPCWAAKYAAIMVCQTGCFEYFLSLLQGNVFGWEADTPEVKWLHSTTAIFEEPQRPDDEEKEAPIDEDGYISPLSPSCETQVFSEYDWLCAEEDCRASDEAKEEKEFREKRAGDIQEIHSSDDDISTHEHERRLLGNSTTHTSASHESSSSGIAASKSAVESTNDEHSHKRPRTESPATTLSPNSSSLNQATSAIPKKKKRSIPHGDDDSRGHKRRKTQSPIPTSPRNTSSPVQQAAVESSEKGTEKNPEKNTKKRSRSHGDDDGDDHEHKRPRTQSPTPTLPPPNAASVPLATVETSEKSSKKRSRSDDIDNDHGNKRQKTQDPRPDMTPHVSSPQQAADGNVVKKRPKVNGTRKSRKQGSALNDMNATSANIEPRLLRRSSRRSGKAPLQELDRSGKQRSIR